MKKHQNAHFRTSESTTVGIEVYVVGTALLDSASGNCVASKSEVYHCRRRILICTRNPHDNSKVPTSRGHIVDTMLVVLISVDQQKLCSGLISERNVDHVNP
ncbi:hypothetical protein Zmor_020677 [Zophobas morio]|uniref:Uncharacterized protein n=1 Tax=Zophobas morio TaxID=2755281 RepID=A0AA38M9U8_9CUCU|nr:hypothetical protein Zmor_020677 [Zophobas morio]